MTLVCHMKLIRQTHNGNKLGRRSVTHTAVLVHWRISRCNLTSLPVWKCLEHVPNVCWIQHTTVYSTAPQRLLNRTRHFLLNKSQRLLSRTGHCLLNWSPASVEQNRTLFVEQVPASVEQNRPLFIEHVPSVCWTERNTVYYVYPTTQLRRCFPSSSDFEVSVYNQTIACSHVLPSAETFVKFPSHSIRDIL